MVNDGSPLFLICGDGSCRNVKLNTGIGYNLINDLKELLRRKAAMQAYEGKLIGKAQTRMILTAFANSSEVIWCELGNTHQVLMGIRW